MIRSNVHNILIIAKQGVIGEELYLGLAEKGYARSMARDDETIAEQIDTQALDLVLVSSDSSSQIAELVREIKQKKSLPIIALVKREMVTNANGYLDMVDDFIIRPYDLRELYFRVERLLRKTSRLEAGELIRCGDLVIDVARCEVRLVGRLIELTFREYELLKFLACNKGRVFTRDALLNNVWGYEYYGGDRTVDVHIRRLRNKIEDLEYNFIETVRNIGYKFRKDA